MTITTRRTISKVESICKYGARVRYTPNSDISWDVLSWRQLESDPTTLAQALEFVFRKPAAIGWLHDCGTNLYYSMGMGLNGEWYRLPRFCGIPNDEWIECYSPTEVSSGLRSLAKKLGADYRGQVETV